MPWCPGCGAEYRKGKKKCPDCGLPLRDAPLLDNTVQFNEKDWTIVYRASDPDEAEMIRGLLDASGIKAATRDGMGALRNLYGPMAGGTGEVSIFVLKSKAEEAQEIIRENTDWSEDELAEYMDKEGMLDDEGDDCYGDDYDLYVD